MVAGHLREQNGMYQMVLSYNENVKQNRSVQGCPSRATKSGPKLCWQKHERNMNPVIEFQKMHFFFLTSCSNGLK